MLIVLVSNCAFPRILQQNKIKTITKKAFEGLEELEHLWVKDPA